MFQIVFSNNTQVVFMLFSVFEDVYSSVFLPSLGHCISLLIDITQSQNKQALRTAAVKCMSSLVLNNKKKGKNSKKEVYFHLFSKSSSRNQWYSN